MSSSAAPCPFCGEPAGFHHPLGHTVTVPRDLVRWARGVERWMQRAQRDDGHRPDGGARSPNPAERAAWRARQAEQRAYIARLIETERALKAGEPVDPSDRFAYDLDRAFHDALGASFDAIMFGQPQPRPTPSYHAPPLTREALQDNVRGLLSGRHVVVQPRQVGKSELLREVARPLEEAIADPRDDRAFLVARWMLRRD